VSLIPFISEDDLEAAMGVPPAATLITQIALDAACQAVRTYLGQDINLVENDVEIHSGSGRRKLRLRERPVRSISSVLVGTTQTVATAYSLVGDTITLLDSAWWESGDDNVSVTYTHGYDLSEAPDPDDTIRVPADIRLVALSIARRVYTSVGTDLASAGGVISETMGDYSYTLASDAVVKTAGALTETEKSALSPYRIELVGSTPTQ
jgi:hypothetical protein